MSDRPELRIVGSGQPLAFATLEEWLAAGARIVKARSAASWACADWIKDGVDKWGEDAARDAARVSGNSPGKISHYLTTATTYPPLRRRDTLTFSHHLEVARLPQADAERILDQAEAEGWSHRRTREAAREASPVGELERLRRENASLRRRLKGKQVDPRDEVERARDRFREMRRMMRGEGRRNATLAEAMAESEAIVSLHGNARRALARDILRAANNLVADTRAYTERMAKAATAIKQGS